jgi:hypothetical protein
VEFDDNEKADNGFDYPSDSNNDKCTNQTAISCDIRIISPPNPTIIFTAERGLFTTVNFRLDWTQPARIFQQEHDICLQPIDPITRSKPGRFAILTGQDGDRGWVSPYPKLGSI